MSAMPPAPGEVELSEHAIAQFRERLRPALDHVRARIELERLLPSGDIRTAPPAWARAASQRPFYLVIGDSVALPLARQGTRWLATTCVTHTTLTPTGRSERSRRKASRGARSRAQRRARS